jgi:hypothetical protein
MIICLFQVISRKFFPKLSYFNNQSSIALFCLLLLTQIFTTSCRDNNKRFYSKVEIIRMDVTNFNERNEPRTLDLEISYPECPGNQIEVIRGNREFAKCILQTGKKVGNLFDAEIEWKWNPLGYYKWYILKLDSCERKIDKQDDLSFDLVEECKDMIEYGNVVGFTCWRIPSGTLIQQCPWFRRK